MTTVEVSSLKADRKILLEIVEDDECRVVAITPEQAVQLIKTIKNELINWKIDVPSLDNLE